MSRKCFVHLFTKSIFAQLAHAWLSPHHLICLSHMEQGDQGCQCPKITPPSAASPDTFSLWNDFPTKQGCCNHVVSLPLDPINHFQISWPLSGECGSRVDISKAAELLQSQQNYFVEWKRETQSCNPMWERLRSCARPLLVSSREATKAKGGAQPDCSSFAHSHCLCKQLIIHEQDRAPWQCGLPGRGEITRVLLPAWVDGSKLHLK